MSESDTCKAPVIKKLSFMNSIWFSMSAIMQMGIELAPRSVSGRIVSMVWRFFILIIVCSYTAHMATQLTLAVLQPLMLPVHSRMASCPEDMEAKIKKQFTIDDEVHGNEESLDGLYVKQPIDYVKPFSNCEMVVTAIQPGIMDFAIAFPKGSKLRTGVNLALATIKDDGEMNRLIRKYFHNSESAMPSIPEGGNELTLGDVSGLFYILLFATVISLIIALIEFLTHQRSHTAMANISIRTALRANSQLQLNEFNTNRRRCDQERPSNGTGTAPGSYAGIHAPFESSPIQSPINLVRAVGSRQVMNRQRSRQVTRQVKKSCEATEHVSRPYFTPVNHNGQEEMALQNSLTQV